VEGYRLLFSYKESQKSWKRLGLLRSGRSGVRGEARGIRVFPQDLCRQVHAGMVFSPPPPASSPAAPHTEAVGSPRRSHFSHPDLRPWLRWTWGVSGGNGRKKLREGKKTFGSFFCFVLFFLFETGSHFVAQAGLELAEYAEYLEYRCTIIKVFPFFFFFFGGTGD
jgi:hypothetical protein